MSTRQESSAQPSQSDQPFKFPRALSPSGKYYPLLCKNPDQTPDQTVLSADGRQTLPCIPPDGLLVEYTEKECWLFRAGILLTGEATIVDTVDAAHEHYDDAKEQLVRMMARARRDVISDDITYEDPPGPDHKRPRRSHVILQIVCHAESEGLETGCREAKCEKCNSPFRILLPVDSESWGDEALPAIRLGFDDIVRLEDAGTVICPVCRQETGADQSDISVYRADD